MMTFVFPAAIQAAIEAGKYVQVFSAAGVPIGMARDSLTGQFVAHAVGAVVNNSPLSPLFAASNLVTSGAQMYQMHQGFTAVQAGLQTIQTSLGVLQATTALIGVGTVATVALSAVNLHQTLKLREDVKQLRVEVKNGFIDLKQGLKNQGSEILELIDRVAQDIKFEQHRTVLIQAYGRFIQALNCLREAVKLPNSNLRNAQIDLAKGMLFQALADYDNPQLLEDICSAGQLRRRECVWAIEQAIAMTYQMQGASEVVSDRLSHLQKKIRQDTLTIIDACQTEDELDFLFPEITRIHNHDLAVLESWQNQSDWMRSLPQSELKMLQSSDFNGSSFIATSDANPETTALAVPPEQLVYENLKQKSHPLSLELQLKFMMAPEMRDNYERYISDRATLAGHKALVPSNLKQASDLAVANLFWYFKARDESEEEIEAAVMA